jgi:glycosyltransferase involved in cell wall biosynthesis
MSKLISLIIPFLNEETNLPALLQLIDNFAEQNAILEEVIFIDDGSRDNSLGILKSASTRSFNFRVIKLSRNFGSHAAIRAGITIAKGSYITFLSADLQEPLDLIPKLLEQCTSGFDICWAVRKSNQTGFFEQQFSRRYASLMQKFVTPDYPTKGFDIAMFNSKVATVINQNIEGNSSIFLQILTSGFSQAYIEFDKQSRKSGKSKWTLSKKVKLLIDSFVAFSYSPIRFVSIVGVSFFIIGICWTTYISARKLLYNDLTSGWPAITSILLLGFGITNISLGIIAEYLWRTLDSSRKRPVFIIDEVVSISKSGDIKNVAFSNEHKD